VLGDDADLAWGDEWMGFAGGTGKILYFLDREAQLTGAHVETAEYALDLGYPNPGMKRVRVRFTDQGAVRFAETTRSNTGRHMAIVVNGVVRSAPFIREEIRRKHATISGDFDEAEARVLAAVIRAGELPAAVTIVSAEAFGPIR
jgi:SecD/SecF fusion protein